MHASLALMFCMFFAVIASVQSDTLILSTQEIPPHLGIIAWCFGFLFQHCKSTSLLRWNRQSSCQGWMIQEEALISAHVPLMLSPIHVQRYLRNQIKIFPRLSRIWDEWKQLCITDSLLKKWKTSKMWSICTLTIILILLSSNHGINSAWYNPEFNMIIFPFRLRKKLVSEEVCLVWTAHISFSNWLF